MSKEYEGGSCGCTRQELLCRIAAESKSLSEKQLKLLLAFLRGLKQ